jgi:catechol 2,3-dioxygenase-like lactoylglutathione lyase family enzyme
MDQRLSLVTLGVSDLERATAFYEKLGWRATDGPSPIAFFQLGGMVLSLWDRARLAEDSGATDQGGWGGITLAHNVGSPAEVDAVMTEALAAGATECRAAAATFWGGYSGVFADRDGHRWEVAHNPHWTLGADGTVHLS